MFSECQKQLSSLPATHNGLLINHTNLRGYLNACSSVEGGKGMDGLTTELERLQLSKWQVRVLEPISIY